jgi:hypothetical protein
MIYFKGTVSRDGGRDGPMQLLKPKHFFQFENRPF